MPLIVQEIVIDAPIDRCFDLARSIDFHMFSMKRYGERAIKGTVSGLIGPGETVSWRARHLGVVQTLTSRIVEFDRPRVFCDTMVRGAFKSFTHRHAFESLANGRTRMQERFEFVSPLGPLGVLANSLFLTGYMRRILGEHNQQLKAALESEAWRRFLLPGT